jgi:hypothetical protein
LAVSAGPAVGQSEPPGDSVAKDASDLFASLCFNTLGDQAKVAAILERAPDIANKLPDDAVLRVQHGSPGGSAWALRSPRNAALLVEFTAAGVCGLRVATVDGSVLQATMRRFLDEMSAGGQIQFRLIKDETSAIAGGQRRSVAYLVKAAALDKVVNISVSTTDSVEAEEQGLVSFGFTSDKF